ncbi:MAG: 3-isopropylmalate dehydratase small subunit, partial [Alphaproteobacteria bacterium]
MEKFEKLTGIAAPLPISNIDTDQIIPAEYLKVVTRQGLGTHAFEALRYNEDGSERADFPLNQEPYRHAKILVTGHNFGCGSSREHAPWALKDFGIRAVISTGFADIFYNNCFKNGMLPIQLPKEQVDLLMGDAKSGAEITIDLENRRIIRPNQAGTIQFEIESSRREALLEGLDE